MHDALLCSYVRCVGITSRHRWSGWWVLLYDILSSIPITDRGPFPIDLLEKYVHCALYGALCMCATMRAHDALPRLAIHNVQSVGHGHAVCIAICNPWCHAQNLHALFFSFSFLSRSSGNGF
ncbi:hypothetical protein AMTRI_Chr11g153750 [Amborella trichopoda]